MRAALMVPLARLKRSAHLASTLPGLRVETVGEEFALGLTYEGGPLVLPEV